MTHEFNDKAVEIMRAVAEPVSLLSANVIYIAEGQEREVVCGGVPWHITGPATVYRQRFISVEGYSLDTFRFNELKREAL